MVHLHISVNRTAQIYLELHFCVELHTKKALLGRVDAYAFSRGQQCSCFTIQITVFYEVRAGEQKVYEWGPKIWKI